MLTPREFELMVQGYKDRERRKASYIQWILAPNYGKKTPKIHEITGFDEDKPVMTREEREQMIAELMKELL